MISLADIRKREIAVWGTGLNAVKCAYFMMQKGMSVKYFLNNNKQIDTFLGSPIYEPDHIPKGAYVIIAVETMETYMQLSRQLGELHLEEFTDYIYYKWIDKRLVLLHGNCHMSVIQAYLESSRGFGDKYAIYPNPPVYNNEKGTIDAVVLKNCDIWIHEDIRSDNPYGYFLSDEYVRQQWMKDTNGDLKNKIEIIVPHLFGLGKAFFPQMAWNHKNEKLNNAQDANGMFPHADVIIDQCVEKGMVEDDIIAYCMSTDVLDKDLVVNNFEFYMNKIKEREKVWDVKIYDFLLENYQHTKLFYDVGHPTNIVIEKICHDILNRLGIDSDDIYTDLVMDEYENPVYPTVKYWLKLQWNEKEIRKSYSARKCCNKMDFKEYIREYLWWIYGFKFSGRNIFDGK